MKRLLAYLSAWVASAAGALLPAVVRAQTDSFDYNYNYETDVSGAAATGLGIGLLVVWLLVMAVAVFFFIFWIMMLVDAFKRDWPEKNTWLIVLIVGFFLGFMWLAALLYYFMVKRKNVGTKKGAAPSAPSAPMTK